MKNKTLFATGILICIFLCACSAKDNSGDSNESLSSSPQTEATLKEPQASESSVDISLPSASSDSLNYEVQMLSQEKMDSLSVNGFYLGGFGSPSIIVKWTGRDELLFLAHKTDPETNSLCRIFSYRLSTDTLTLLNELSGYNFYFTYFCQDDVPYLLWDKLPPQICEIGNNSLNVKQIEPFVGEPSSIGELAVIEEENPSIILCDFLNPEKINAEFQIENQGEFVGWSPDGQYLTFHQSDKEQYNIYDRQGNLKQSVLSNQLHWCEKPNFITFNTISGNEGEWTLLNIADNTETPLPSYPDGTILLQEPDFALIIYNNDIMLFDHETGECMPVQVDEAKNSFIEFAADYNEKTGVIALACWTEQGPACYLTRLTAD